MSRADTQVYDILSSALIVMKHRLKRAWLILVDGYNPLTFQGYFLIKILLDNLASSLLVSAKDANYLGLVPYLDPNHLQLPSVSLRFE